MVWELIALEYTELYILDHLKHLKPTYKNVVELAEMAKKVNATSCTMDYLQVIAKLTWKNTFQVIHVNEN